MSGKGETQETKAAVSDDQVRALDDGSLDRAVGGGDALSVQGDDTGQDEQGLVSTDTSTSATRGIFKPIGKPFKGW